MRKQKVYLETSLFNFYIDKNKGIDHTNTVRLFEGVAAGRYEAFTSTYVIEELERADHEKSNKMLNLISDYGISILVTSAEVVRLADIYVENHVVPRKFMTDGLHIAIATVHGLDMIISMNLRHIVKGKTIKITTDINIQKGYRAIEIRSPAEVVGYEEKD